jgi:predicted lipoprotein with Yx(FWY)xxD motif
MTAAPSAMSPTSPPATGAGEATIKVVMDSKLGNIILFGNNDMTLYTYSADPPDQSTCTGGSANIWPALLTQRNPVLGSGVDSKLLGTATLANGSKAVTYNQMVLYYFSKDAKAGDTTGQGVGNVWYTVSPAGKPVGKKTPLASFK